MKIRLVLNSATAQLEDSTTPRLDVELLLAYLLKISRSKLLTILNEDLSRKTLRDFDRLVQERKLGKPVAYLTGIKEFWSLDFIVTPDVLIPRPATELLVERALNFCKKQHDKLLILDLGTGSGCIAIALAKELIKEKKDFEITAVDISKAALKIAKKNAKQHQVQRYVNFIEGNWFDSLQGKKYNLILANPPYVNPRTQNLARELEFEPNLALFSKNSGLKDINLILEQVGDYLAQDGFFICEIGAEQGKVLSKHILVKEVIKDLAGRDRFIAVR